MEESTWQECVAYAEKLFAGEGQVHGWILRELEARGLPLIQVSPLEGRLLALLARAIDARRLLEIGTLGGYSALWLLSLLSPEARLTTVERDPACAALAREAFERAGEAGRVELLVGDARDEVPRLLGGPAFDLVFIDADKQSYPEYLEWSRSLLRPGGLVIGDNAFWDGLVVDPAAGDGDTAGVREFNRRLAEDPRFQGVIVPIRDGLAVARFNGEG